MQIFLSEKTIECCGCGFPFVISDNYLRRLQRKHKTFYCPACGRSQHFPGESDVERLERLLAEERAKHQHAQEQREAAERSKKAIQGHMTRLKKRVANGVCPCCRRSFVNLQRHMKTKHPKYVAK